jgi:DNA-binding MarR family transcriptional regulator
MFLRTWRAGPQAGQPKLSPAIRSMLERGLIEIRRDARSRLPYAFFTEAGVTALRRLAQDRRALDPVRFAHIRRELGTPAESDEGAEG